MPLWNAEANYNFREKRLEVDVQGRLFVEMFVDEVQSRMQMQLRADLYEAADVAVNAVLSSGVLEAAIEGAMRGSRYKRAFGER